VEAFILNRVVVTALDPEVAIPDGLLDAVEGLGFGWQMSVYRGAH
jgi:hypothetical protein